jgi:hypothetical protein
MSLSEASDRYQSDFPKGGKTPFMHSPWGKGKSEVIHGSSIRSGGVSLSGQVSVAEPMGLNKATAFVNARGLDKHRVAGVLNKYPSDSLVIQDFKREHLEDFQARAVCVADAVSAAKAIARIGTDPTYYAVTGANTLHEWWNGATDEQKLRLLTRSKHVKGPVDPRPLSKIPCPFQDTGLGKDFDQGQSENDGPKAQTKSQYPKEKTRLQRGSTQGYSSTEEEN